MRNLALTMTLILLLTAFVPGQAEEIRTFAGHDGSVRSVAFSPDGARVLTGSSDNTARLWDASNGAQFLTFAGHGSTVTSVAFSPDGARVLTGSNDRTAKLWDSATGSEIRTFNVDTSLVTSVDFSADGSQVLTGSLDYTVKIWETNTGNEIRTFGRTTSFSLLSATFSPDDARVLTGATDRTAKLWDADTGNEIRTFEGHGNSVSGLAFSPEGNQVLTGSLDNTAKLWDAATGNEIRTFAGHTGEVRAVAFSPDGTRVLTGSSDQTAKLWDAATGNEIRTFTGHSNSVNSVAFSPDGTRVLTGSADTTAKLWDAQGTGNGADTTPPVAICRNATVTLDAAGLATLTPAAVDNGSSDDVGITTRTLSRTAFTCGDVGTVPVTLTVSDAAGNQATCTAQITVVASAACGDDPTGTAEIRGLIFDPQAGAPLTCAAVEVRGPATRTAAANGRGEYRVTDLPAGAYTVTVFYPGGTADGGAAQAVEGAPTTRDIAVTPAGATLALEGTVTQESTGVPLGGVRVEVFSGGQLLATTITCASGRYGFTAAALGGKQAGEVSVTFSATGYDPEEREVTLSPTGTTLNVDLTPKAALDGALAGMVSGESGPLAGAVVTASRNGVSLSRTTAADGRYLFAQLEPASHLLEAAAPGHATASTLRVLAAGSSNTWDIRLESRADVPLSASQFRDWLRNGFAGADANGDGALSRAEAESALPGMPPSVFDAVDTNGDGQISREEAGLTTNDGGDGDGPCCGTGAKSLWESLGDLMLVGMLLTILLAMRTASAQRP